MNGAPIIAIVDDDASVRRSLLRVVQSAGYIGKAFTSAREFLTWLSHDQAACLVLDIHMNELSGFELHDRLKVPVVFISGHDDAATLERIAKSRAAGHLRKPFDRAAVLAAIHRAVGAPRADGEGSEFDSRSYRDEGGES
ncbi:MAG: response regulator transcription factor [Candidatus Rokuibacteriota bacterium]